MHKSLLILRIDEDVLGVVEVPPAFIEKILHVLLAKSLGDNSYQALQDWNFFAHILGDFGEQFYTGIEVGRSEGVLVGHGVFRTRAERGIDCKKAV